MKPLDRIDLAIVGALQLDGRLSNKELAAKVGLAPSSCLERVRALREAGVIRGFRAEVDPAALGLGLEAIIALRLSVHSRDAFDAFRAHLYALPEVVAVFYVSGREDFLVHVVARDTAHLRDLITDSLSTRPEVNHLETSLVFERTGPRPLPIPR